MLFPEAQIEPIPRNSQSTDRSHFHSTSPNLTRHSAAGIASAWEFGARTLVDSVRSHLRQGFRSWVTYTRHNKLKDLHSSVLQALQFAVSGPPKVVHGPAATANNRHNSGASKRESRAKDGISANSGIHALLSGATTNHLSQDSQEVLREVFQEYVAPERQPKIQSGASFVGSRYHGHSLRLRSKERHVRAKEKKHGTIHPEVVNALLSLAGHHAEKGNAQAQQESLQRIMDIQQEMSRQDHERVQALEKRVQELEFAEISAAKCVAGASCQGRGNATSHRTTWHNQQVDASMMHKHGHGLTSPGHRVLEARTDVVLRRLYADQACIDEVINLASTLWQSGFLAAGRRESPILKSSLLLRMVERWYHIFMRDVLLHLRRQGSRPHAAHEARHHLHHHHRKDPHHHQEPSQARDDTCDAWQDPHHSNSGRSVDERAECQQLRAELRAMEKQMAGCAVQASTYPQDIDARMNDSRVENNQLKAELTLLRYELYAERESNRSRAVVEQPTRDIHVDVNSRTAHSSPHPVLSHRGKLVCNVLRARHLKFDATVGAHADHPFIIARVGAKQFQTKVSADLQGNFWEQCAFEFSLNLRDPYQRVLFLKVVNHDLFQVGESLGDLQVGDFHTLPAGQVVKRTEKLHHGHGAEIDLELCLTPEHHLADHHDTQDDVASWDGDQRATPDGVLLCRIRAAREMQDTYPGHHSDHEHRVTFNDAFIVAHSGQQDFRTKSTTAHSGSLVWNMESPFRFQHVDISHKRQQYLYLKIYNDCTFHASADHCIGSVGVCIPKLDTDKWVAMRESLHDGNGNLEFDLCFMPDGETEQDDQKGKHHEFYRRVFVWNALQQRLQKKTKYAHFEYIDSPEFELSGGHGYYLRYWPHWDVVNDIACLRLLGPRWLPGHYRLGIGVECFRDVELNQDALGCPSSQAWFFASSEIKFDTNLEEVWVGEPEGSTLSMNHTSSDGRLQTDFLESKVSLEEKLMKTSSDAVGSGKFQIALKEVKAQTLEDAYQTAITADSDENISEGSDTVFDDLGI